MNLALRDVVKATVGQRRLAGHQGEAAKLYAAGHSPAWLFATYGVSHTTVATALRRQGIQVRRRPGWRYASLLHGA